MFSLPVIAVLKTKDGIVLRYVDGTQSPPIEVTSIRQCDMQPYEQQMVQMACNTTGWVTEHYHRTMIGM